MKYPRTFHLPWSPGGTNDDKKMISTHRLINEAIVISEKLDGSNSCFAPAGVFARSHGQAPKHASFDLLKQRYYSLKHLLNPSEEAFLENCFAVHSITYELLSDFCFLLNIRQNGIWLSYPEVVHRSEELHLTLAPVLFTGIVTSETELRKLTEKISREPSVFGGMREGVVVRTVKGFLESEFSQCVGKWVRENHVQTDEHWVNQPIVKQNFSWTA